MPELVPVLVAQLDTRLTGDQEVAGSTPAGSATFFIPPAYEVCNGGI